MTEQENYFETPERVGFDKIEKTRPEHRAGSNTIKTLAKRLLLWGLLANAALPGLESITTDRRERRPDESRPEQIDPEVARNEENIRYLKTLYGAEIIDAIARRESYQSFDPGGYQTKIYRGSKELIAHAPEAGKDFGLTPEELRRVFLETYPKNFSSDVESITLEPGLVDSLPDVYGARRQVGGVTKRLPLGSYMRLYGAELGDAVDMYSHELGHANDWGSDLQAPVQDRIQLLRAVSERYLSGDSLFSSNYVESIHNDDPGAEVGLRVMEYWGEICREYFQRPGSFYREHPRDFMLVDEWVKKQNPDYNPFVSAQERQGFITSRVFEQELLGLEDKIQQGLLKIQLDLATTKGRQLASGADVAALWTSDDFEALSQFCLDHGLSDEKFLSIGQALYASVNHQISHEYTP